MSDSKPTDLSNLHDIVLPPEISWWPLQWGWWALISLSVLLLAALTWKQFCRYRADAWRRRALELLEGTADLTGLVTLLRSSSIAIAGRDRIRSLSRREWLNWMGEVSGVSLSPTEARLLETGPYKQAVKDEEITNLKEYSRRWLRAVRKNRKEEGM